MDKIIINYLQGNISLEEQHRLKKWLDEDEAHPVILEQMKKFWSQGELHYPEKKQVIFGKLMREIQRTQGENEEVSSRKFLRWKTILKYAAIVLIVSMLSIFGYSTLNNDQGRTVASVKYVEKVSLPGQKVTTTLPDGTIVKLNTDSKILVPEVFGEDKREVTLIGEAFFDVVSNPKKPFYVHFKENQVKVLGTSFNINAYDGSNASVAVRTGKVMVKQGDEEVQLSPHEMTELNGSILEVKDLEDNELIFGWIDNKLIFNKASIQEALEIISKWYGKRYELKGQIDNDQLYTASHNNPTLKEVMEILTYTYGVNYEILNDRIIIK